MILGGMLLIHSISINGRNIPLRDAISSSLMGLNEVILHCRFHDNQESTFQDIRNQSFTFNCPNWFNRRDDDCQVEEGDEILIYLHRPSYYCAVDDNIIYGNYGAHIFNVTHQTSYITENKDGRWNGIPLIT